MGSIQHSELYARKSTNGRSLPAAPAVVKGGFAALSAVWPAATERAAAWLFCHPQPAKVRDDEQAVLDAGHAFTLRAGGFDLPAWSWGDGPTVLLHHGWSGRASHMTAFVEPLVRAGYSVVAYDAPAHGDAPGRITSGPEMAGVLRDVAWRLGGLHAVVAHSVGGAATMLALRKGLKLERAVLLAPPSDMREFIDLFGEHLGLDRARRDGMARVAAGWYGIRWEEMSVEYWGEGARTPIRVIHDRHDSIVPWRSGARIHEQWGPSELISTTGLGHRRIRQDPDVIAETVAFIGDRSAHGGEHAA